MRIQASNQRRDCGGAITTGTSQSRRPNKRRAKSEASRAQTALNPLQKVTPLPGL